MTGFALKFSLPAAATDNGLNWNNTNLGDRVRKSLETGISGIAEACNPGGHHEISTDLKTVEERLQFVVTITDRQQTLPFILATGAVTNIFSSLIRGADFVGKHRAMGIIPLIRWEHSQSIGTEDRDGTITLRAPFEVSGGMIHFANFLLAMDYEQKGLVTVQIDGETIDVRVATEPTVPESPEPVTFSAWVNAVDDRAKTGHFVPEKGRAHLLSLPDEQRNDALNAQIQRKQVVIVAMISSTCRKAQRVTGKVVALTLVETNAAVDNHKSLQIEFDDPKKARPTRKGRAKRR